MKPTKFLTLISLALFLSLQSVYVYVGAQSQPVRQNADEYVTDATITTKVKAELLAERDLKSSEVSVKTYNGNVQLSGFMSSQADIKKAVEITQRVRGVKMVTNNLYLKN